MNEWKELKIDDLPSDFLTDCYEVEKYFQGEWVKTMNDHDPMEVLVVKTNYPETQYRLRKRQPKAPTHEEIMTKWWYIEEKNTWVRVGAYKDGSYYLTSSVGAYSNIFFANKKSATIPPEAL